MSFIDHAIEYKSGEVIISVGYYSTFELEALYESRVPALLVAYEPLEPIYNQYCELAKHYPTLTPVNMAVTGDGRNAYLTVKRRNTNICLPKSSRSRKVHTVRFSDIARSVYDDYGIIDKLLMNCEGSEVDIISKTSPEIFGLCSQIVVSFHTFVPAFNIDKVTYKKCLEILSKTHDGHQIQKSRCWWLFNRRCDTSERKGDYA